MSKKEVKELVKLASDHQLTQEQLHHLQELVANEIMKIQDKHQELDIKDLPIRDEVFENTPDPMETYQIIGSVAIFNAGAGFISLIPGLLSSATFPIIYGTISVLIGIPLSWLTIEKKTTEKDLISPSKLYSFLIKIAGTKKKYLKAQKEYLELLAKREEYHSFYNKKMRFIEPALKVLNENSNGRILTVNHNGELEESYTKKARILTTLHSSLPTTPELKPA